MKDEQTRHELVRYWFDKSGAALAAARREHAAGDLALAMNRVYYACFYSVCAVLTAEGLAYAKHSTVRTALHQHLVKTGRLAQPWGAFYNRAFDDRQEADYEAVAEFDDAIVSERIQKAEQFTIEIRKLVSGF